MLRRDSAEVAIGRDWATRSDEYLVGFVAQLRATVEGAVHNTGGRVFVGAAVRFHDEPHVDAAADGDSVGRGRTEGDGALVILTPTVLVLGAGASSHLDFPSGSELKQKICAGLLKTRPRS